MTRLVATVISWLFIPLLMPIYTLLILFNLKAVSLNAITMKDNLFESMPALKIVVLSIFFILIFVAPGFSLILMKRKKHITSIELDNQHERSYPILLTGFYSLLLTLVLFKQLPPIYFPTMLHSIAILGVVSSVTAFVFSKYFKISLHAMGASLMLGTLICYYQRFFISTITILLGVVFLGGIIMASRYLLSKHTLTQLISGYLVGLFISIITITLIQKFI